MSQAIRKQSRTTTTGGEPVPDQFWTITSDTGPLPGPSPVPGPLPISAVTAIGAEIGNPAANAIDGNLATRWSNLGKGSWIQVDLAQLCTITEVDIAWYKGDQRVNTFSIDISPDRKSFVNVFNGQSTGKTLQLEPHTVKGNAVLVKITVNGNTQNDWASITEIAVKGAPATPNPTPTGAQAVIAQPSQTVAAASSVLLDGTQSKGDIAAYMWAQTSGPQVTLFNASTSKANFIAPATGPLGFSLRVTDKSGQTSTANCIIQIQTVAPLKAIIGIVPASVTTGQSVTLDGSHSIGAASYFWFQPHGTTVALSTPSQAVTSYTVPALTVSEDETFDLTVTGPTGATNTASVTIHVNVGQAPPSSVDVFGIQKIYADRVGTYNNWHLTSASDPRFMEQKPVGPDAKGYYTYSSLQQGRIEVLSDTGASESSIPTFDVGKVIDKGFLYKPIDSADGKGDWGDVEITVRYADVVLGSGSFEAHPEIAHGGLRQTNDTKIVNGGVPAQCEAMSYHSNWYSQSHRVKYEKDSKHTAGYTVNSSDPQTTTATQPYAGKPDPGVIHKSIMYRVPDASIRGGFAIKLETWVDETGSGKSFKKVLETLDNGKWGPTNGGNSACNCGSEYVVLNMGKCASGIRIDFMNSFKWKDWSIRSIDSGHRLV